MDSSGNVIGRQAHLPFGEDFGESGTQEKHHFTSYERDGEGATDYAVNRQYSQSVGRFMRVDPVKGSISIPQRLNGYTYVRNNPINSGDPLGLMDCFRRSDGCWVCDDEFAICDRSSDLPHMGGPWVPEMIDEPEPETPPIEPPPAPQPCANVSGFTDAINGYSAAELNDAAITVFGELFARFNENSRAEAEAIASIIFNRLAAILAANAPSIWGGPSLSGVVSAAGQFAGFAAGSENLRSGVDMNEGERNCNRLQTAGSAIAWLAANAAARGPYLYMCAQGHVTTPHANDVTINHNVFSTDPLGCVP